MTVADDLFAAIERGDVDAIKGIYAPDAVIWHNNDEIEQTVTQNLRVLAWMGANFSERSYEDVRRTEFDGGFVQQHVLKLTKLDGTKVELPACIVATVADGKITRIDEYLDSAHVARIAG
jgi:ketosteroid isomerase-like protein